MITAKDHLISTFLTTLFLGEIALKAFSVHACLPHLSGMGRIQVRVSDIGPLSRG